MSRYENINVLKGQQIPTQGKRRVALGWYAWKENACTVKFAKENFFFRTKMRDPVSREKMFRNSVRLKVLAYCIEFSRTVSLCILYPGRRFGSFLPQLCPGLDYLGLSGRENYRL